MAQFFIHRPVFAWVVAIIVMICGYFGLSSLPVAQYPNVAPPTIRISATYTGASAAIVADSVTSVIEDGMTGLDGLLYMTSSSTEGSSSLSLYFDSSQDPDMAQVQVQNKLQLVQSSLPSAVTSLGVSVTQSDSSILMVGALISPDGRYSEIQLGNMFSDQMEDTLQRLEGVGSINVFGSQYAMRIWLQPDKLYQYQLTASDVTAAVSAQNTNVTVGALGAAPSPRGQQFTVTLSAQSQLSSVDQFAKILLKTNADGSSVFLGDVARIELGNDSYSVTSQYNGSSAAGFAVSLSTGANALDTSALVKSTIANLAKGLPPGVEIVYPYDTTPFVQESISQVYHTLLEAIVLVFVVIMVFLQNWRATLIPTLAVPVVLLGTFGVLAAFGLSINTLTMFALVLAIGLLVDDAIVVVENVERLMEEEGLGPVEATEKSMREITSALVGIVVVLSSVFLPMAFLGGSTGIIYRQFSITIIAAMVLSLFVALILTPALCAHLLKPSHGKAKNLFSRKFNGGLDRLTGGYLATVMRLVRRPLRMLVVVAAVGAGIVWLFPKLPTSFVPSEDQGVLMAMVTLPEGATPSQTQKTVDAMRDYLTTAQGQYVESTFAAVGFSFAGTGSNAAMMFIKLKPLEDRPEVKAADIAMAANIRFSGGDYGQVYFLQPPAIQSLGTSDGFDMYLVDRSNTGLEALGSAANQVVGAAMGSGQVTALRGNDPIFKDALNIRIDQQKAQALGLSLSDINSNLSTIFAGSYVNDFTLENKLRRVRVQADGPWRMQPEDIGKWYVANSSGEMVPIGAFSQQVWGSVATRITRFNAVNAMELQGSPLPGVSSGDAMATMQGVVDKTDGNYGVSWAGLSYQEQLAGNQQAMLYLLSAVVVFLCLAALYESWTVPVAVMLAVPVGVLGAIAAAMAFGQSNDVYFKVGLLTTVGLAARNAILIVEFAEALRKTGRSLVEAARDAAGMRLRPILMTSFAFGLGVLPLARASGTGANAQNSIGIGMLGGICFSTLFGIVMVPILYVAVMKSVAALKGLFSRKVHHA